MSTSKKTEKPKGTSAKKSPAKPKPKPRAKTPGRKTKADSAAQKSAKSAFLPLFSVWFVAVVVLAGLLYWAESTTTIPHHATHRADQQKASSSTRTGKLSTRSNHTAKNSRTLESHHRQESPQQPATRAANPLAVRNHPAENPGQHAGAPHTNGSAADHSNLTLALNRPPSTPPQPPAPAAPSPYLPLPPPPKAPAARVAIVIDDFGRDIQAAQRFLNVPLPLTFSVLPFRPHSGAIVQLVHSHGREVILHVPMEPLRYPEINPGEGALLVNMSPEKIRAVLSRDLDAYPFIAGINNHMGSRFTEDSHDMRVVLNELRQRGLFFLDSYTTDRSVGYTLARRLDVPTARRNVFLDDEAKPSAIRFQIERLIHKAKIDGSAIAIGHPHPTTYEVLRQAAELFRQQNIAVVPLKELILLRNQQH